jgi:hypothetical protein
MQKKEEERKKIQQSRLTEIMQEITLCTNWGKNRSKKQGNK